MPGTFKRSTARGLHARQMPRKVPRMRRFFFFSCGRRLDLRCCVAVTLLRLSRTCAATTTALQRCLLFVVDRSIICSWSFRHQCTSRCHLSRAQRIRGCTARMLCLLLRGSMHECQACLELGCQHCHCLLVWNRCVEVALAFHCQWCKCLTPVASLELDIMRHVLARWSFIVSCNFGWRCLCSGIWQLLLLLMQLILGSRYLILRSGNRRSQVLLLHVWVAQRCMCIFSLHCSLQAFGAAHMLRGHHLQELLWLWHALNLRFDGSHCVAPHLRRCALASCKVLGDWRFSDAWRCRFRTKRPFTLGEKQAPHCQLMIDSVLLHLRQKCQLRHLQSRFSAALVACDDGLHLSLSCGKSHALHGAVVAKRLSRCATLRQQLAIQPCVDGTACEKCTGKAHALRHCMRALSRGLICRCNEAGPASESLSLQCMRSKALLWAGSLADACSRQCQVCCEKAALRITTQRRRHVEQLLSRWPCQRLLLIQRIDAQPVMQMLLWSILHRGTDSRTCQTLELRQWKLHSSCFDCQQGSAI